MKLSFCSIGFQKNKWGKDRVLEMQIQEILPILAKAGYDGVEIWEPHIQTLSKSQLHELRNQLDSLRLEVAMVSPYFNFTTSNETAAQSLEQGLQLLHKVRILRGRGIRIFTGKTGSKDATGEQWERAALHLQKLADACAADSIQLTLETHPWNLMDTVEGTIRLLKLTDRNNVRIIFQPSTFGSKYLEAQDALSGFIGHVHATNSKGEQKTLLAEGTMNYRNILQKLRQSGFNQYVCVEWFGEEPAIVADKEAKYLRSVISEV